MDNNDELKEIDIKNLACYYFDDIIKVENFDPDNTKQKISQKYSSS